ncbi:MAG: NUDIX hydrolase [Anaerolineales bacterium]
MGAHDQGADATAGRWTVIPRTLCLVTDGDDVLLMKRGPHKRVFPNRYNGLGGHIERDEDPLRAAVREIREEAGIEVSNPRLRGVINIDAGQPGGIMLFVVTAQARSRAVGECDEGTLEWVPLRAITGKNLVEDLPILLPRLFGSGASETPFSAHVSYTADDRLMFRFNDDE